MQVVLGLTTAHLVTVQGSQQHWKKVAETICLMTAWLSFLTRAICLVTQMGVTLSSLLCHNNAALDCRKSRTPYTS